MVKSLFIYDWDDNIMFMPSILRLERFTRGKWIRVRVTPNQWSKIKNNDNIRNFGDESFFDFYDDPTFIKQLSEAIYGFDFGPSYDSFKQTLINGDDFAILTARGHSREIMITGVMMLIFRTFGENDIMKMIKKVGDIGLYLSGQEYFTVHSDSFNERFSTTNTTSTKNKKAIALHEYIHTKIKYYCYDYNDFQVLFSDDDVDNVEAATNLFYNLKVIHPNVEFKIFDTSKKKTKEITI